VACLKLRREVLSITQPRTFPPLLGEVAEELAAHLLQNAELSFPDDAGITGTDHDVGEAGSRAQTGLVNHFPLTETQ
jgi:hypothetical protein